MPITNRKKKVPLTGCELLTHLKWDRTAGKFFYTLNSKDGTGCVVCGIFGRFESNSIPPFILCHQDVHHTGVHTSNDHYRRLNRQEFLFLEFHTQRSSHVVQFLSLKFGARAALGRQPLVQITNRILSGLLSRQVKKPWKSLIFPSTHSHIRCWYRICEGITQNDPFNPWTPVISSSRRILLC